MGSACSKRQAKKDLLTSDHLQYGMVRSMHRHCHDLYEVVEVLGEGSTSKISKVKKRVMLSNDTELSDDDHDVYFALKEIDLTMVSASTLDELENEIKLLKALVRALIWTARIPQLSSAKVAMTYDSSYLHSGSSTYCETSRDI